MIFHTSPKSWALSAPSLAAQYSGIVATLVVASSAVFLGLYTQHVRSGGGQGLPGSKNKWILYASTGLVSVFAWGFNSFGLGILIMTLFHGIQYLCLVWHSERESICEMFEFETVMPGDSKLKIDVADYDGWTALQWAGFNRRTAIAQIHRIARLRLDAHAT